MKSLKFLVVFSSAMAAFHVAAETLALYTFNDGAVGSSISSVTNSIDGTLYTGTGSACVKNDVVGTVPVFSDDVPGTYIYDGLDRTKILIVNPQSAKFYPATNENNEVVDNTGGFVSFDGLATKMSELDEGTIEFFAKVDTFRSWRTMLSFNAGQPFKVASQSQTIVAFQNFAKYNVSDSVITKGFNSSISGVWKHYAVTWSKASNRATCYIDHALVGSVFLTNTTLTASNPVYIGAGIGGGNELFDGKVTCLRLSSKVLDATQMLYALETLYSPESSTIGFWDFNDGESGEAVDTVINKANPAFCAGVAGVFGEGEPARFSNDVPGVRILDSFKSQKVISKNPKAIHFTGDGGNSQKGSGVSFPGLSEVLAQYPAWTVEFFARRDAFSAATWRSVISVNFSGLQNQSVKVSLPAQSLDRVNIQEQFYNHNFRSEVLVSGLSTDQWAHYAITFTNNEVRLYLDYTKQTQSRNNENNVAELSDHIVVTNDPLNITLRHFNLGKGSGNGGYEQFAGDVCCLRVSTKVLDDDEFMIASSIPSESVGAFEDNSTVFHWRGEGQHGETVTTELSYPAGRSIAEGTTDAINTSGTATSRKCAYNTEQIKSSRPYVWYGKKRTPFVNTSCIEFFAYDNVTYLNAWDASVLTTKKNTNVSLHPESWTMECFFKIKDQASYPSDGLLFGKGSRDNLWSWRLRVISGFGSIQYEYGTNAPNATSSTTCQAKNVTPPSSIKDGQWHHLALSYDNETKTTRLYLDYEKIMEFEQEFPIESRDDYVYRVGRFCNVHGFAGWMDEIRYSNKVLSPEAFLRLMPAEGFSVRFR